MKEKNFNKTNKFKKIEFKIYKNGSKNIFNLIINKHFKYGTN
jgi:hypothetical protein